MSEFILGQDPDREAWQNEFDRPPENEVRFQQEKADMGAMNNNAENARLKLVEALQCQARAEIMLKEAKAEYEAALQAGNEKRLDRARRDEARQRMTQHYYELLVKDLELETTRDPRLDRWLVAATHIWARGRTREEAMKKCFLPQSAVVYRVTESHHLDDEGRIVGAPGDPAPQEVERFGLPDAWVRGYRKERP